jgi:Family of unknown function (DUF5330)
MWFLLRVSFWLGVLLVVLPTFGSQPVPKSQVVAIETMSAAKAAIGDFQQLCERKPDACTIGSQTAATLAQRAQIGAKMLYDFFNDQFGAQTTGSVRATRASGHTLTADDLVPAWRGPQPQDGGA